MIEAIAHPNVALIKYWGKQHDDLRIPATPSLSIPLLGLTTKAHLEFSKGSMDEVVISGNREPNGRVTQWLDTLRQSFCVDIPPLQVESMSDFPASSGLASSASGFAALVRGLNELLGLELDEAMQSRLARLGSASAARSIGEDFMVLDGSALDHDSWFARKILDWRSWPLGVSVALCSGEPKAIPSAEGMLLGRETSPRYGDWISTNRRLFEKASRAIEERNFDTLAWASRWSFYGMLSVMRSSEPPVSYLNRASHAVIQAIGELQDAGVQVFFTCDAGPQVKCVYLPEHEQVVRSRLVRVPGVLEVRRACS